MFPKTSRRMRKTLLPTISIPAHFPPRRTYRRDTSAPRRNLRTSRFQPTKRITSRSRLTRKFMPWMNHPKPAAHLEQIPSIAARHTEWMDMMAPPPSEYPNGGWMSNLTSHQPEPSGSRPEPEAQQAENHSGISPDNRTGISEPAGHAEEISDHETEHGHGSQFGSHFDSEDRFFANAQAPAGPSYHFPSESRDMEHVTEEIAPSTAASRPVSVEHQIMVAPTDAERREEAASNRPAPEPLLVDEEHTQPSDYSPRQEQSSPTQHILPAPVEEQNAQSAPEVEQLEPSVFEPAAQESSVQEFNERIPTLPDRK